MPTLNWRMLDQSPMLRSGVFTFKNRSEDRRLSGHRLVIDNSDPEDARALRVGEEKALSTSNRDLIILLS